MTLCRVVRASGLSYFARSCGGRRTTWQHIAGNCSRQEPVDCRGQSRRGRTASAVSLVKQGCRCREGEASYRLGGPGREGLASRSRVSVRPSTTAAATSLSFRLWLRA